MKTTIEQFNLTTDELLDNNENGCTKEENLLFDSGLEVVFLDDDKEFQEEINGLKEHMEVRGYEVMETLKTINGRVAVILR